LEDAGEGAEQGEEDCLHPRNAMASNQKKSRESISTRFLVGASYLQGLETQARCVTAPLRERRQDGAVEGFGIKDTIKCADESGKDRGIPSV